LEEERRLAHVGLTRARKRAKIYFVSHRLVRGTWTATMPSRFVDELPETHVAVDESKGSFGGFTGYGNVGGSRFDQVETFGSTYSTPGWQRAKSRGGGFGGGGGAASSGNAGGSRNRGGFRDAGASWSGRTTGARTRGAQVGPVTIEGELVAKSTGTVSAFAIGDRVFHQKFGNGNVLYVEGNKLTIAFDRAGEKKVVDSFVERV
ncbi:MAG TPA: AAA family ATPase, partial [Xanthobacteraceae bacterium]|nr:AAA family ATPase [Xanthobacteraceae bacterium]